MNRTFVLACVMVLLCASIRADVVELNNGDKITGTIGQISGGKMKFHSTVLGDLDIDLKNVKTFSTEAPATIQRKKMPATREVITSGNAQQVTTANGNTVQQTEVVSINPPPQQWTGAVVVNGSLARGNTEDETLGATAEATLRRQDEVNDDRFTLQATYNFSRSGIDGGATTSTDNWMALGKYDRFWTDKWYGYALFKYEHDRIAALNYRLSPGVGVGYQWIEKPDLNFRTEAGVSYVYEDYSTDGSDDHVALRLAYHFDKSINDKVKFFHDLEWLPAIDDPSDYNLNTDAGIRVSLTEKMFSEFKFEYDRDSTPAPGRLKNDLRYTLGVGWSF